MLVTLFGIVMLVRLLQYLKVPYPMLVTLSGIVTLVRPLQPEKTSLPNDVTPLGIDTDVIEVLPWNALFPIVLRWLGDSNVIDVSCCPENALAPICSTFTPFIVAGILISLGALASELYPMIVLALSLNMK